MAEIIRKTAAFEVRDGGPFVLHAWNWDTKREEIVSTDGRRLLFPNRQTIEDWLGHQMGRGPYGNSKIGYLAVLNIRRYPPEHTRPQAGDLWIDEWYRRYAGDETPTDRRRAGLGGVRLLTART